MKQRVTVSTPSTSSSPFFPPTAVHPKLDFGKQDTVADQEGLAESGERIQKQSMEGAGDTTPPPPSPSESSPPTAPARAAVTPSTTPAQDGQRDGRFLVSDTTAPQTGQMRKSVFLDRLNAEVCAATDEALRGTPFSSDACPYIRRIFERHRYSSPAQLEAVLHRYDARTLQAGSAADLIAIIRTRTREAVTHWKNTGDLSHLPPEIAVEIPASARMMTGAGGFLGGIFGGFLFGISSVVSGITSGIGNLVSGIGRLFFKGRAGGANPTQSPAAVRDSLGAGRSLDSQTRGRMENAFGSNFDDVKIHDDLQAGKLTENVNARAFTVGKHIAFGKGEYRPGSAAGEVLIAHELAHIQQQRRGQVQAKSVSETDSAESYEQEADRAAAHFLSKAWGMPLGGKTHLPPPTGTGLQIQRCGSSSRAGSRPSAGNLESMTPWQLSRFSTGQRTVGTRSLPPDYLRAGQLATAVFRRLGITYDIDTGQQVLGRRPGSEEQQRIDRELSRLLSVPSLRPALTGSGGRGIPANEAGTPSLAGKVRILDNQTQYAIKRYQLQMLVMGLEDQPNLDTIVRDVWREFGITPGEIPRIVDQERKVTALYVIFRAGIDAPGFYHPGDDIFYLAPGFDINSPLHRAVARHETVHLLAGRNRTLEAFIRRYTRRRFLPYWSTFEEGMADLIAQEASTEEERRQIERIRAADTATTTQGTTTVERDAIAPYEGEVRIMRQIMGELGRETVFRAYFTGTIPDRLFTSLESRVRNP